MNATIRYRISDGHLLEANFGLVGTPGPDEALIELPEIPAFAAHCILGGKVVERDRTELDAGRAEAERHRAEVAEARARLAEKGKRELADVVADLRMVVLG